LGTPSHLHEAFFLFIFDYERIAAHLPIVAGDLFCDLLAFSIVPLKSRTGLCGMGIDSWSAGSHRKHKKQAKQNIHSKHIASSQGKMSD
jgi:hypothetical protein